MQARLARVGRLWAIAINTFREAVRDRVLHGLLGLGVATLFFTLALAQLSLDQQERVVRDLGLSSISLFSVLVAIFLGSSLLYKEIERKTLYVILPKPLSRAEFLLGKYAGICMTVYVFVLSMGALQLWLMALLAGGNPTWLAASLAGLLVALGVAMWKAPDRTVVMLPWSAVSLAVMAAMCLRADVPLGGALAQLALVAGEVAVLAAAALLFSSFSTPFLTGVFTLGLWLSGRSADDMATLNAKQVGEGVRLMLRALAEVVPNLHLYAPGHALLFGADATPWPYVGIAWGYALLYILLTLLAATAILSRRDFL